VPKKRAVLAGLFAASCTVPFAAAAVPHLYITTESSPPTSMQAGAQVIGSGTDKVREIMARTGITYTIDLLPWKRAYTFALQRPDACIFSTTRTPEREKLFKWVGPTDESDWVLLARANHRYRLNSLEDARALRIGTYNGDARDDYLRARGFNVDPVQNDRLNGRKLLLDRIDLWAASFKRGTSILARNGWKGEIVPVLTFNHVKLYLACNPAVPDALIASMNAALATMERDGTVKKLDRKYDRWGETRRLAR
jgi:polar amino acid transport system substrate-binding protein